MNLDNLKFRAISMCRGEHWVYGLPRHYASNPHTEKWTLYDPQTGIETDIEPETLGQFTGLFDKDGNEIYEGDIMAIEAPFSMLYREVKYSEVKGAWIAVTDYSWNYLHEINTTYKVVGNIHDNPELLKQ